MIIKGMIRITFLIHSCNADSIDFIIKRKVLEREKSCRIVFITVLLRTVF